MSDVSTLNGIKNLLNMYGLNPKKGFGQNFLLDKNILNKIIASLQLSSGEYVVEIGPGLGVLTQELAKHANGVLAVDIDTSLRPLLLNTYGENEKIRFIFNDILKTDIEQILQESFGLDYIPEFKVCANIPYNITTPIIFHLLHNCRYMVSATLMMQKEVANRLLAQPGSKEYGRLTIMTACRAKVELVMNVSHNCFYPRPEVDSAVVRITPFKDKPREIINEDLFYHFIKGAFSKRRKTILNICTDFFRIDKEQVKGILGELGINPLARPENLQISDLIELINYFAVKV